MEFSALAKLNRKSGRSKVWAELWVWYFYLRWFRLAQIGGFTLHYICTEGNAFVLGRNGSKYCKTYLGLTQALLLYWVWVLGTGWDVLKLN